MKVIKTIISVLKFVRYNSKTLSITSIIACSIFNVMAMTPLSVKFEEIHPFAGNQKAMDYYKSETWNENLTLKENQDNLVKKFMEKCCEVDPYKVICNEYRQPVFEIRSEYNAFAEQMLKKNCTISCRMRTFKSHIIQILGKA